MTANRRAAKKQRRAAGRAQRKAHDRSLVMVRCESCGLSQPNLPGDCRCGHGYAVYA